MKCYVTAAFAAALVAGTLPAMASSHRHHSHHHRSVPSETIGSVLGRPFRMIGQLLFGDDHYRFISGGAGASIPYGTYPITPDAVGSWGSKHQAIGINHGQIWDDGLKRYRTGIEIHGGDHNVSLGCITVHQFDRLRQEILASIYDGTSLFLHVSAAGIKINAEAGA